MLSGDEREERVESAAELVRYVMADATMHPDLRRRVLLEAFWFVSEATGKYSTRYQSVDSLALKEREPSAWRAQRRHEHVFTRRSLTARLLDGEDPRAVMADSIGCVVLRSEHDRLTPFDGTHVGWDRYRAARVAVLDTATGERFV